MRGSHYPVESSEGASAVEPHRFAAGKGCLNVGLTFWKLLGTLSYSGHVHGWVPMHLLWSSIHYRVHCDGYWLVSCSTPLWLLCNVRWQVQFLRLLSGLRCWPLAFSELLDVINSNCTNYCGSYLQTTGLSVLQTMKEALAIVRTTI